MKLQPITGIINDMAETGTAILKKLDERASYGEIQRYLLEVEAALFRLKNLPEEEPPTYIFCPPLEYPQSPAKEWAFAYKLHQASSDRERYLYFGDIFKLVDEIQAKLVFDGEQLIRKNPDSQAARNIADLVSVEKDFFTLTNLYATRETITPGQEERLARYREDMREEIGRKLLVFAQRANEIARELGEDVEVLQELEKDAGDDVGEATKTEEESGRQRAIRTEEEPPAGGEESQPEPPNQPERELVREQFEDIFALNLETERLTNLYIDYLENTSHIPREYFSEEMIAAIRTNARTAILERLGISGINELYANPVLRLKAFQDLQSQLNKSGDFFEGFKNAIRVKYEQLLQASDLEGAQKFRESIESGNLLVELPRHLADAEIFTKKVAALTATLSSKEALLRTCSNLPYFDSSRLDFEVNQITEVVDALSARGIQPSILERFSAARFNLLFGTSLTPTEFEHFKSVLSTYWLLRRHEFIYERGLKIDWRELGLSDSEIAEFSDQQFKDEVVKPTHTLISTATNNGTRSESHVVAVGTGAGDNSKVEGRPDAAYIKKLKEQIYQQELWRELSDARRIAILQQLQYGDDEIQQFLELGSMPPEFTIQDLGAAEASLAEYGIDDDSYDWDASDSPFSQPSSGESPLDALRRKIANKKTAAGAAFDAAGDAAGQAAGEVSQQAGQHISKQASQHAKRKPMRRARPGAGKAARQATRQTTHAATKKARQKAEKEVDKAITGGAALAANAIVPGSGALISALPPEVRELVGKTLRYIGGAVAAIGALLAAATAYLVGSLAVPVMAVVGGVIGGIVGFAVGGPVGAVAGVGIGAGVGAGGGALIKSTAVGTGTGASHSAIQGAGAFQPAMHSTAVPSATTTTATAATATPTVATTATVFNPAASAVGYTVGSSAVFATITTMLIGSSLLADFPPGSAYTNDPNVKLSYYADLEKTVETGCPDNKCPEITSGTVEATYTITIKPKGEGTCITVTEINDIIKTRFSKKKYEELGKPLPSKPDREKHLEDFPDVVSTDVNDPRNTVCTGEVLTFTYTETFDKSYNHSLITNTFEAKFYWKNSTGEGNDSVMTGKSICIGDCAMESGCWPTTGSVSQAPFSPNWSHAKMDAFDIANPIGTPVYAIFPGELCPGNSDPGYGNHVILTAEEGTFLYGHLSEVHLNGGCKHIEAGETVGLMGNTGNSTGPHLHFEIAHNGGWFRASKPSLLHHEGDPSQGILPPSDDGTKPITPAIEAKYLHVTSCYDGQ